MQMVVLSRRDWTKGKYAAKKCSPGIETYSYGCHKDKRKGHLVGSD